MLRSAHGRPLALYGDCHSIFTKHDPEDPVPTQFERAAGELNIESILAYSPQTKGRVERAFRTLQDRLVKALRLARISNIEAANAWLPPVPGTAQRPFRPRARKHRQCAPGLRGCHHSAGAHLRPSF